MAWQTPKTNWQAADVVSKDDFNRIEGNIQHLQDTVARGTSTFAGQGNERVIAHGLGATPKAAYATPTEDPQGRLGEVWIRMTSTHLYVGNSGSFTGGMSWVAFL